MTRTKMKILFLGLLTMLMPPLLEAETVFVEGEDFKCDGKSWQVKDQRSKYTPDSGLKHLAGARGGPGTATKTVDIKEGGHYFVWVRHTVLKEDKFPARKARGPFLVTLKQNVKTVAQGRIDEKSPDPPYVTGFINHYFWSLFEADLTKGNLEIELSKLDPIQCSNWTRYVDCLVLTADLEYKPKITDFLPKTWLRVTVGPSHKRPIFIYCFVNHYHEPYFGRFCLSKDGYSNGTRPKKGRDAYLVAGESTPWCDITEMNHEDRGAILHFQGVEASFQKFLPHFDAVFEFATAPNESAVVKRFHRQGGGGGVSVIIPGVLNKSTASQLKWDREFCEEAEALTQSIPDIRFGKKPEKFPLFLNLALNPEFYDPDIRRREYTVATKMGFNGIKSSDSLARKSGLPFTTGGVNVWLQREKKECYLRPKTDEIKKRITRKARKYGNQKLTYVKFMDEPGAKSLEHAVSCNYCAEAFRIWLRDDLKIPLEKTGKGSWDEVKPVGEKQREDQPVLFYYSQLFRPKCLADFLRLQTKEIGKAFPGSPPATVNFPDSHLYAGSMYSNGVDYFRIFKSNSLTMAWSEDWSILAATSQNTGYNVELLRAACKYHHQPIGMYVITSFGRTPLDVKLKAYSAVGHGANVLCSYSYGPKYTSHEPGWYLRRSMYHPMAELAHEIGGAEDLLVNAKPISSETAFLHSTSSDIWTSGSKGVKNTIYGLDRIQSHLALTHAQVPVDILSEKDIAEGRLTPYKALYVFGPNLLGAAAKPIADWVKKGGVLYLAGGSAMADEFNQPTRELDRMLDLSRGDVVPFDNYAGGGRNLWVYKNTEDKVTFGKSQIDVIKVRQNLAVKPSQDCTILAKYDDGKPAAIKLKRGKGTVIMSGFLPGPSYISKALKARGEPYKHPKPDTYDKYTTLKSMFNDLKPDEMSANPWQYPRGEREFLLQPIRQAGIVKPVELSQPVVESSYLAAREGAVVTLANYTLRPIDKLKVTMRPGNKIKKMESVRHGPLKFEQNNETVTTELPLQDTDMLKLYW